MLFPDPISALPRLIMSRFMEDEILRTFQALYP
jgi:hypothetical protein